MIKFADPVFEIATEKVTSLPTSTDPKSSVAAPSVTTGAPLAEPNSDTFKIGKLFALLSTRRVDVLLPMLVG